MFCSPSAQILRPAKWKVSLLPPGPKKGEEATIVFDVGIVDGWFLYSSDFDSGLGPTVTEFAFEEDLSFELLGEIGPVNPSKKYDSLWEGEYTYFKDKARFLQKIKILEEDYRIKGAYTYQVCSELDGKCILFNEDFRLGRANAGESGKQGLGNNSPYSLLSFMLVAFLAGLAALLTPCVFPLIPMTVTYFTGKDKNKKGRYANSLFYGFSIILIYSLFGMVLAPFMGPETANDLATSWLPNLIFFVAFLIFALSFFGLFEITLPHNLVNNVDALGEKKGLVGVFFMALTLVLVSFSCTGPIVGSILVESAGGFALKPVLGMFAFSVAFAIPFTGFALFPGWLRALPKSGGWLNSVKVVLGFVELALSLKFLSVADQAYHWNLLDREIYLAFWVAIFTLMGFYLLGKIKLSGDGDLRHVSVTRLLLAILSFTFVIYLIPGMFGAPLKAMAGYLPPMSTHDFDLPGHIRWKKTAGTIETCEKPIYGEFLDWPHGLKGYFDHDQAVACAKSVNKPIFVDFTGHGCVNCREMEVRVWPERNILDMLANDFVLLALYVDDKTELPENKWYTSAYDRKVKKTIGKQNADLQIKRFQNNSQPLYVIISPTGELLAGPRAYDLDPDNFVSFLEEGKRAFVN